MNLLKNIFHYTPLISILILFISTIWVIWIYLPNVGKGSDAAGRGMAQGYAFIYFSCIFILYALILLLSLYLFIKNIQAPVLRAVLNCILLSPLLVFVNLSYKNVMYSSSRSHESKKSFHSWQKIAKTQTYISPSGHFRFQYSSHCKGTFNISYIERIKLQEIDNSIVLFIPKSNNYFLGSVKLITVSPQKTEVISSLTHYLKNYVDVKCSITKTENHPFKQFDNNSISVYTFGSNKNNCMFNYIQNKEIIDRGLSKMTFTNSYDIYFIQNSSKPDMILEIVIGKQLIIAGPVEKNLSLNSITEWHQTISF